MRLLINSWMILGCLAIELLGQTNTSTNRQPQPISLEESIALALKNNLGLQIERANTQVARYNLSIGYGGYEPTFAAGGSHNFSATPATVDARGIVPASTSVSDTFPGRVPGAGLGISGLTPIGLEYNLNGTASDTVFSQFVTTETSHATVNLNLKQPLLKNFWIDETRMNIMVRKNQLKSSELALRLQVMTVVNNVAQAYYELIFARENIKVQQTAVELAERLVAENRKRVQVGTLAPLDEKQAESQAAGSRADLITANNNYNIQENVLKGLLTADYTGLHDTELVPSEVMSAPIPLLNLMDSWAKGVAKRPDLLQARLDVERQNILLRYSYNQLFPQLDLGGSYGFSGSGIEYAEGFRQIRSGSSPNYYAGAAITFPLGNRAARGAHEVNKETKKQLLLTLKNLEQNILIQIDNSVKQVQNAFERVDATRQARVFAETALDAEQKKLESGKSTSFQVLLFQRDLTARRSDEIRALADFNKALSLLYFQEGSILERNHIGVDLR